MFKLRTRTLITGVTAVLALGLGAIAQAQPSGWFSAETFFGIQRSGDLDGDPLNGSKTYSYTVDADQDAVCIVGVGGDKYYTSFASFQTA